MAENTPSTGGNKPKPPAGGARNQSAKDKSRAQSRPIPAKAPTPKAGKAKGASGPAKGGNRPRPGQKPVAAPTRGRFSGAMMAWGVVGLVIVIIVVLVIVKVTGGSSTTANASYTPVTKAPASVIHDVTNIPVSVFNKVGITSNTVPVSPPIVLTGQPALSLKGKSPAMLYLGAEYCPYCAAERWAMTAALSRFGTWSGLEITASSHTDVYPETHTFSYRNATLTSPYLTFSSIEELTNIPTANGSYTSLQSPTKEEAAVITKYSNPTYISGATAGQVSFPFINIGNKALISGASYSPGVLSNLSWTDIASNLDDPTNPATQAIVATANYISAAICASTSNAPASVCNSPGVEAATKALKLG
jgi:Domain of unknown function (DUF929)